MVPKKTTNGTADPVKRTGHLRVLRRLTCVATTQRLSRPTAGHGVAPGASGRTHRLPGRTDEPSRSLLMCTSAIDGTGFFSRGDPNWRIHVALEVDGTTQLAVVTSPALGRCWWATRGGGSFESSWPRQETMTRRLAVSTTSTLAGAVLDALDDESRARLPPDAARAPASPLPLVELVRGEIDAFLAERYYTWDHAPWILLVEEAGGRFTDRSGGRASDRGGGLYSNAALHGQLLAALNYPTR